MIKKLKFLKHSKKLLFEYWRFCSAINNVSPCSGIYPLPLIFPPKKNFIFKLIPDEAMYLLKDVIEK